MDKKALTLEVIESRSLLTDLMIDQWRELENSALESNIYLSPDFILPSLQYLSENTRPVFIFVYQKTTAGSKMVFAAIFEEVKPTFKRPFRILASYTTSHSFLSGILVDASTYESSLDTFFEYWSKQQRWQAMDFWWHWSDRFQDQQIKASAKRCGLEWTLVRQQERAAILIQPDDVAPITKISKNLLKNITKKRAQLAALGDIEYLYIDDIALMPAAIQSFLELEHQGWKGKNGSSLLSHPAQASFFSSMTLGLAKQNKVIFTEMRLSGKVIASTVNYISGNAFFAFKTARDESLDQYSLGIINEVALIEKIPEALPKFQIFDSGSETGSYMDNIWKDKLLLTNGYFTRSVLFRGYLMLCKFAHRFK